MQKRWALCRPTFLFFLLFQEILLVRNKALVHTGLSRGE